MNRESSVLNCRAVINCQFNGHFVRYCLYPGTRVPGTELVPGIVS